MLCCTAVRYGLFETYTQAHPTNACLGSQFKNRITLAETDGTDRLFREGLCKSKRSSSAQHALAEASALLPHTFVINPCRLPRLTKTSPVADLYMNSATADVLPADVKHTSASKMECHLGARLTRSAQNPNKCMAGPRMSDLPSAISCRGSRDGACERIVLLAASSRPAECTLSQIAGRAHTGNFIVISGAIDVWRLAPASLILAAALRFPHVQAPSGSTWPLQVSSPSTLQDPTTTPRQRRLASTGLTA